MWTDLFQTLQATLWDTAPIVLIIVLFQAVVIRRRIPHFKLVAAGFLYVLAGMTLFLVGLQEALFPLGKVMAQQLTDTEFLFGGLDQLPSVIHWTDYGWVYVFAATVGFATTVAEPALIAVSIKAHEVSAGSISINGLRFAVAFGVAIGIALGAYRIITGTPLWLYIVFAYVVVIVQTMLAPRMIIALAYDSGGVTTSTVTVPLVTALGLGLASHIPGRSPVLDGFGLIAFASVFPIMSVLGYAQISRWMSNRLERQSHLAEADQRASDTNMLTTNEDEE